MGRVSSCGGSTEIRRGFMRQGFRRHQGLGISGCTTARATRRRSGKLVYRNLEDSNTLYHSTHLTILLTSSTERPFDSTEASPPISVISKMKASDASSRDRSTRDCNRNQLMFHLVTNRSGKFCSRLALHFLFNAACIIDSMPKQRSQ